MVWLSWDPSETLISFFPQTVSTVLVVPKAAWETVINSVE